MRMLTTEEKAEEINVTVRALVDWRSKGTGPKYKKFGKLVRYYPETLPDQTDDAA